MDGNFLRFGTSTSINGDESVETIPELESSTKRWLRDLWASRHSRIELLLAYWIIAIIILLLITRQSWLAASIGSKAPRFFTCRHRLWDIVDACTKNGWDESEALAPSNSCLQPNLRRCGLGGNGCLPFNSTSWVPFHCAESCAAWPVFGTAYYRADSVVCAAATHAGVIGASGGCALMQMVGHQSSFEASCRNGVCSKGYNYSFPSSFSFKAAEDAYACNNLESTFILTALTLMLASMVLFRPPKPFLFAKFLLIGFWIVLVALTPELAPATRIASLSRDLPLLVAGGVYIYFVAGEHAMYNPVTSNLPNIFFYLIPFMAGLSVKSVFTWVQSNRRVVLSTSVFLVIFVSVTAFLLVYHVWLLCQTTCLKRMAYSLGYLAVSLFYLISWAVLKPDYGIEFRHPTIPLILIPLTRWRNRPIVSITQALLVGSFVNGLALDGWQSDFFHQFPNIIPPSAPQCIQNHSTNSSLHLSWNGEQTGLGLAMYINFVEVQRQYFSPENSGYNFSVFNLSAQTSYEVLVSTIYDENKMGPPSQMILCNTT